MDYRRVTDVNEDTGQFSTSGEKYWRPTTVLASNIEAITFQLTFSHNFFYCTYNLILISIDKDLSWNRLSLIATVFYYMVCTNKET